MSTINKQKKLILENSKKLLMEDNTYNGLFQVFWGEVEKGFSNFAKVVKGSVEKVSRAAVLWITINFPFTPFKTKSEYSRIFREYERDQARTQTKINQALAPLEENLGPVKAGMLAFAPGAVLSAYAFEGARGLGSDEFKGFLESSGLQELPIVGGAVKAVTGGDVWFDDYKLDKQSGAIEDQRGVMTKTFELVQKAFINPIGLVFGESKVRSLYEGDEENQKDENPKRTDEDIIQDALSELENAGVYLEIEKIGSKVLELKKDAISKIMDPMLTSYKFSSAILTTASPEEFVQKMSEIKDPGINKIDVSSLVEDLEKSVEEIKNDEKKLKDFKKQAEKEGIKTDDPELLDQKIKETLWKVSRKDMIKVAADSVESSYETVKEFITEDYGPDEMKMLMTTDIGLEHAQLINNSMEKLDKALTDIRSLVQ
ncbi:MAG: hypothetical protein CBC29_07045 [Methylococcaceae bacterium TMED69]|nr:MAG: hypothetical protein CBC29_07045 [Methylococcaceae bacterium TMED69]|tara:strand:+ start:2954 stop:4240 length:1287 start_codon:yes stop_codon:yes gene_type:complete